MLAVWKKNYDQPKQILKSRNITLLTKIHLVKAMVFSVVMYGCETWTIKKAEHQRTDTFELWCWRRLLSPLDCKEIKPINPKGNQSWIFTGRTDAEAEAPIFGPPDVKSQLTGKDTDPGLRLKIGGEEGDRGWDGWMASLTQWTWIWTTPGDGEGQGSLACCNPWGCKESDTSEQLNSNSDRQGQLSTGPFCWGWSTYHE